MAAISRIFSQYDIAGKKLPSTITRKKRHFAYESSQTPEKSPIGKYLQTSLEIEVFPCAAAGDRFPQGDL